MTVSCVAEILFTLPSKSLQWASFSDGQIRWIHRVEETFRPAGQVRWDTVWPGTTSCSLAILSKLPFKNSSLLLPAFTPVINNHWSLRLGPLAWCPFEKRHPVVFGWRVHLSWSVTTGQDMQQTESAGSEHLPRVHTFESLQKAGSLFLIYYMMDKNICNLQKNFAMCSNFEHASFGLVPSF